MVGSTCAYPKITRNLSYLSEVFTRAFRACNSRTGMNAGFSRARGNGQAFALAHATKLDPTTERSFQIPVTRIRPYLSHAFHYLLNY
jgi:hypothetical protein